MDLHLKQIFLLLLFVPGFTCRTCLDERNLKDAVSRKSDPVLQHPTPPLRVDEPDPATCPLDLYRHRRPSADPSTRSLSPWRYVLRTDSNYFPSSYYEAECLCSGCIMFDSNDVPYQNRNFNSKLLEQTRLFRKKKPCGGGNKYPLTLEPKKVAVGCTCVMPP